MSYTDYYTPTNWENYPSENTAINATRLNHLEDGVDELDNRIVNLSTNKSEVSWNQTLIAGQKIAEITINGIQKNVYAPEISDSIVEEAEEQALKAEGYAVGEQDGIPVSSGTYYHNNAKYYSEESADAALISEGYANGTQNGEDVDPDSPYYHNNAKFWSEQKAGTVIKNTTGQFYTTTGEMLDSCVVALSPKQSGSGTPSTSNVRPITGHPSGEVLRVGKNWLNSTLTSGTVSNVVYTALGDGTYNLNGTSSTNGGADFATNVFLKAGTYKILGLPSGVGSSSCYIGLMSGGSYVYTSNDASFTLSEDTTFDSLRLRPGNGKQFNNVIVKPMITTDLSATYDTYEPYNGQDITIQFGNTYYGGTYDFVSGVLTVTHKYKELTSSDQLGGFATSAQYGAYAYINDTTDCLATDGAKVYGLCSMCEYVSFDNRLTTANVNRVWSDKNNAKLFVRASASSNVSTVTELYNIFANAEICYELATPQIIQLSPSQINTLVGQNNLSAPLEGQSFASAEYRDNMSVVYITDERVVGKWIDGKDIYQRTIDLGSSGVSVPANSSASTGLAKGNVQFPIWSTAISPSGQAFPHVGCSVGSTYIMMENKTNNATSVRYFTFQYTKQ